MVAGKLPALPEHPHFRRADLGGEIGLMTQVVIPGQIPLAGGVEDQDAVAAVDD